MPQAKDALQETAVAGTPRQLAEALAQAARVIRKRAARSLAADAEHGTLRELYDAACEVAPFDGGEEEFADMFAQTVVCCAAAERLIRQDHAGRWNLAGTTAAAGPLLSEILRGMFGNGDRDSFLGRLGVDAIGAALRGVDLAAVLRSFRRTRPRQEPLVHLYELFLESYSARRRKRSGVFCTPRPIVSFIVRSVDEILRREFGLPDGLADTATWGDMHKRHPRLAMPAAASPETPFVRILDPAVGTGTFLVEVIEQIHGTMRTKWESQGHTPNQIHRLWSRYVRRRLLARLCGFELLTAPLAIAHLQIGLKLAETGYRLQGNERIHLYLTDTLRPVWDGRWLFRHRRSAAAREADAADALKLQAPVTVVLGNPPFAGVSSNMNPWIDRLLKGRHPDGGKTASYYEVDGRPLGERKLWLQDDYVKFIRYAHWRIAETGCGVLAYVSNHGYMDNPTFRGMRQQLIETFGRITVVDLHGNLKKRERAPDGGPDQNVFGVEQGVAVGLFRRQPGDDSSGTGGNRIVLHGELWGETEAKLERLDRRAASDLPLSRIAPVSPFYFLYPRDETHRVEYERGCLLSDVMPIHTTAPVTARDRFVVAFEEGELLDRVSRFRDLSIPDATIRQQYFRRTRSTKYPPGDSRGWKLHDARRRAAADADWRERVETCLYRPFDRRAVYWADWMIDWPRTGVTRHMLSGENVALIARRQMLASRPCDYFWITDAVPLDGVIRSDNRGSESLFPLYVFCGASPAARSANFHGAFVRAAGAASGLLWREVGPGDLETTFGPEDLLHLIYATFHSPAYRARYAEMLRIDFPRVFLPASVELFRSLCRLGGELAALHMMRPMENLGEAALCGTGDGSVGKGFPKYDGGKVFINPSQWFDGVPENVWAFHVGGHQVLRKWLRDRRGRILPAGDVARYRAIVAAVGRTIAKMHQIDRTIDAHGGWPEAFCSQAMRLDV